MSDAEATATKQSALEKEKKKKEKLKKQTKKTTQDQDGTDHLTVSESDTDAGRNKRATTPSRTKRTMLRQTGDGIMKQMMALYNYIKQKCPNLAEEAEEQMTSMADKIYNQLAEINDTQRSVNEQLLKILQLKEQQVRLNERLTDKFKMTTTMSTETQTESDHQAEQRTQQHQHKEEDLQVGVSLQDSDAEEALSEVLMKDVSGGIKEVTTQSGGSRVITCTNKEQAAKLKKVLATAQDLQGKVSLQEPKVKTRTIQIRWVPTRVDDERIKAALAQRFTIPEAQITKVSSITANEYSNHWKVDLPEKIAFKLMHREGYVFLGMQKCQIREHAAAYRCGNCESYICNYTTRSCPKLTMCTQCAAAGHKADVCPSDVRRCIACYRYNEWLEKQGEEAYYDEWHPATSPQCPIYRSYLQKDINRCASQAKYPELDVPRRAPKATTVRSEGSPAYSTVAQTAHEEETKQQAPTNSGKKTTQVSDSPPTTFLPPADVSSAGPSTQQQVTVTQETQQLIPQPTATAPLPQRTVDKRGTRPQEIRDEEPPKPANRQSQGRPTPPNVTRHTQQQASNDKVGNNKSNVFQRLGYKGQGKPWNTYRGPPRGKQAWWNQGNRGNQGYRTGNNAYSSQQQHNTNNTPAGNRNNNNLSKQITAALAEFFKNWGPGPNTGQNNS